METQPPLPSEIWDRIPPEAQACIEALVARVAALEATVKDFTERLQQNSHNSSRPPSSDASSGKRRGRRHRQPSGRTPGGQPGHRGQTRALIPVEDVDEVIVRKPSSCATCHHALVGEDPQPHRHQAVEIPPMRPVVTDYQGIAWAVRSVAH